jgi:putative ABC transport system substrate-binding protein
VVNRRAFLGAVAAGLLAAPRAVGAQAAGKVYRIGVLEPIPAATNTHLEGLRQGLREGGYVEGQNLVIEYRSTDGHDERFPELARELVRSKVDLIVTRGTPAVVAAHAATRTIPIVMAASADPVGTKVVASLANPGGNVTGLSALNAELVGKRLELLRETIPGLTRVAFLFDMGNAGIVSQSRNVETATRAMGLQPQVLDVRRAEQLAGAFDAAVKQRADAMVVALSGVSRNNVPRIVELAARRRLPAIYAAREYVTAGGLMAYGVKYRELYRHVAKYVVKILKGAKPGDLPVEEPTTYELVVNLKTAQALGLTIPQSLLVRSDEVIR